MVCEIRTKKHKKQNQTKQNLQWFLFDIRIKFQTWPLPTCLISLIFPPCRPSRIISILLVPCFLCPWDIHTHTPCLKHSAARWPTYFPVTLQVSAYTSLFLQSLPAPWVLDTASSYAPPWQASYTSALPCISHCSVLVTLCLLQQEEWPYCPSHSLQLLAQDLRCCRNSTETS